MRTETLWQGERRAARLFWWRQVLDGPSAVNRKDLFDQALVQRFWMTTEPVPGKRAQDLRPATSY